MRLSHGLPIEGFGLLHGQWLTVLGDIAKQTQPPGSLAVFLISLAKGQGLLGVLVRSREMTDEKVSFTQGCNNEPLVQPATGRCGLSDSLFQQGESRCQPSAPSVGRPQARCQYRQHEHKVSLLTQVKTLFEERYGLVHVSLA
jgi:hypothetical protein